MSDTVLNPLSFSCPTPRDEAETVQLAHGGGGRTMRRLIEQTIAPTLGEAGAPLHDSAVLDLLGGRLAFTTDSFVVNPLFFPGGDIGKLAVCGTVNDLAMAGAKPQYLSCGLILEEGTPLDTVERVLASMRATADASGVRFVTGDTKVVDRGKGDGLYVNTTGVGVVPSGLDVHPRRVRAGDCVIVSGDVGRHGTAIMSVREGLEFEGAPGSDCAPLHREAEALASLGADLHCLRDLTRGGLASALVEIAEDARVGITLTEGAIPVHPAVGAACEMLGLDPLYVANEGRFVAFVPEEAADAALAELCSVAPDAGAAVIGRVVENPNHDVVAKQAYGASRLLILLAGDQLPRIC